MGNDVPRSCANRLAIGAMSSVTEIEKAQIRKIRDKFAELGGGSNVISRDDFVEGLDTVELVESDREILDRLFVMLDRRGEERVNMKEFVVALVPLVTGPTSAKLDFALEIYDFENFGKLDIASSTIVLATLNSVASFFGDPVLRADQIDEVIDGAARALDPDESGFLPRTGLATFVAKHSLMVDFLEAKGSARYDAN